MGSSNGVLKLNVDGAARRIPGPAGVGGVLSNSGGVVVALFSKGVRLYGI